ncbi:hypothetical protein GCK72_019618 [Caenorhabditis remanei]|uniref:Uncharacterized protein n=1 Tax=Caenorhabditis remanei TaxID=31234 RepID=A0A6A5GEZ0_CAERE|nr:hypothetical protein GCK72_019618 [Caenorhabditis remanei]KAF1753062.1 hypothetical protein GCK72_019618 [Caenorhabditis remanei]
MMRKLKLRISTVTYQKHQEAIRSLLVQSLTSVLCIVPVGLLGVFVRIEVTNNGELLVGMCIVWFLAHSSINMIFLLIFFPPFRNFVSKIYKMKPQRLKLIGGPPSSRMFPSIVKL